MMMRKVCFSIYRPLKKKNATKQIVYLILGNVDSIAEDTLFKLWGSKLKHYELDPLIARVAEQVIALN